MSLVPRMHIGLEVISSHVSNWDGYILCGSSILKNAATLPMVGKLKSGDGLGPDRSKSQFYFLILIFILFYILLISKLKETSTAYLLFIA